MQTAGRRLPRGHGVIGYGFFTPAIATLSDRFAALRFTLRPLPAD